MSSSIGFASLRKGMLEPLVLGSVSTGPAYAAEVLARLSRAGFPTQEGTLYPLLSRMGRDGLLSHEWQESAAGPPRKYYALSNAGRRRLSDFHAEWASLTTIIETIGR